MLNSTEKEFVVNPKMLKISMEYSSLLLIVIALITYRFSFASKLEATINVRILHFSMLIFRRTLGTFSYNLAKHYLNHPEFKTLAVLRLETETPSSTNSKILLSAYFNKYLNVMAWKLKSKLPQINNLMVLQYLNHFYAEVSFLCIFQIFSI